MSVSEELIELHPTSSQYPARLKVVFSAPPRLWIRGNLDSLEAATLAVVGAREASHIARAWVANEACAAARAGITLISGGARGIDEQVHAAALKADRPTVVVLPGGLDVPYPPDWARRWRHVVCAGGALVSRFPPGTTVRKSHFEIRNRLLVALAHGVVVVEGRFRSGTALTARQARDVGRPIGALPWFPGDPRGELNLELLQHGATLIRDHRDLLVFAGLSAAELQFT